MPLRRVHRSYFPTVPEPKFPSFIHPTITADLHTMEFQITIVAFSSIVRLSIIVFNASQYNNGFQGLLRLSRSFRALYLNSLQINSLATVRSCKRSRDHCRPPVSSHQPWVLNQTTITRSCCASIKLSSTLGSSSIRKHPFSERRFLQMAPVTQI